MDSPEAPLTPEQWREVIATLGPPQRSTFVKVLEADGQSCGLAQPHLQSLVHRALITTSVDELTQGVRLCTAGCGHVWYEIPEDVRSAYDAYVAAQHVPPPPAPLLPELETEHPATVALAASVPRPIHRPPAEQYWARIMNPLYGSLTLYGESYDQGQLLTLRGEWGDERLIRLEFVQLAPHDKAYLQAQCGVCGIWFLNEHFREKHGRLRHRDRFATGQELDFHGGMDGPDGGAALRDITGDAADRRQWVEYPPNLEHSKASQQA